MMDTLKHIEKFRIPLLLTAAGVFLVSCGSYQQASYYDGDGIYGDVTDYNTPQRATTAKQVSSSSASNYQAYFARKSEEFSYFTENDYIFTDIDSYSSTRPNEGDPAELVTEEYQYTYQGGYPGWGDNPQSTSLNIYNNTWGWGGWGAWGWADPFWGWGGWGPGWGWNNWGWGGWGLGWGWNNWGWGPGWGWNNWGWGGHYYHPRRSYAYSNTRRYYDRGLASTNRRSSAAYSTTNRRSYNNNANVRTNRSSTDRRAYGNRTGVNANRSSTARRTYSNSSNINTNRSGTNRRTYSNSSNVNANRNATYNNRRSNSSGTNVNRSSAPQRSYSTPARSGSSMRSSSPARSSGGATRSSSSSRRGGR